MQREKPTAHEQGAGIGQSQAHRKGGAQRKLVQFCTHALLLLLVWSKGLLLLVAGLCTAQPRPGVLLLLLLLLQGVAACCLPAGRGAAWPSLQAPCLGPKASRVQVAGRPLALDASLRDAPHLAVVGLAVRAVQLEIEV